MKYQKEFLGKLENIYLFKVNNRNTRKKFEIFSKLTKKTPERLLWIYFISIIVFGNIFRVFL